MHTEAHLFSVPNDCLWYDKLWGPSQRVVTLFAKWYLQSCSDEHVHFAEEQAHPQHGGHRHIFPGQASPKTFSFSYIDVTLLEEPLLVNRLWANIDEKVPSVRKC